MLLKSRLCFFFQVLAYNLGNISWGKQCRIHPSVLVGMHVSFWGNLTVVDFMMRKWRLSRWFFYLFIYFFSPYKSSSLCIGTCLKEKTLFTLWSQRVPVSVTPPTLALLYREVFVQGEAKLMDGIVPAAGVTATACVKCLNVSCWIWNNFLLVQES